MFLVGLQTNWLAINWDDGIDYVIDAQSGTTQNYKEDVDRLEDGPGGRQQLRTAAVSGMGSRIWACTPSSAFSVALAGELD